MVIHVVWPLHNKNNNNNLAATLQNKDSVERGNICFNQPTWVSELYNLILKIYNNFKI